MSRLKPESWRQGLADEKNSEDILKEDSTYLMLLQLANRRI